MIPLLNTKSLDDLPPRILRFRLRLAKYKYVAGIFLESCYLQPILSHEPPHRKVGGRSCGRK